MASKDMERDRERGRRQAGLDGRGWSKEREGRRGRGVV